MAIEGYSPETAAQRFADWEGGVELEQREIPGPVRQAARNMVDAFELKPNEDFYVVTDGDVVGKFPEMILAIREEAQKTLKDRGRGNLKLLVATPAERSAVAFHQAIGDYLTVPGTKALLIITRMSRTWSEETQSAWHPERVMQPAMKRVGEVIGSGKFAQTVAKGWSGITPERLAILQQATQEDEGLWHFYQKGLEQFAKERQARIISSTKGTRKEVFTEGAILEPAAELAERTETIRQLMAEVSRVHITTKEGTNVWLELRSEYPFLETGKVDQPGMVMNIPYGEWAVLPAQKGSHGTIVIHDSPMGGAIPREEMDGKTVTLKVENGKLISIGGGSPDDQAVAEKFRTYLDHGRMEGPGGDPFTLAELGVGANKHAWREVDGQLKVASTSAEGEKAYGTVHIAFGANGAFGQPQNDPELTRVETHADSVVLKPTVECFRKDGSSFFLIKEGEPQGY